ncbi:MAG: HEAT repeat domain-containing protein, partial [Armatimonadetes bacterium]|nr:HEAT repeat domain-containing protein [Armatimonadota bacterium]
PGSLLIPLPDLLPANQLHHDPSLVVPHIKEALCSPYRGVRWWAAHWAMDYPSEELIGPLEKLLSTPEDEDAHYFALSALGFIAEETENGRALQILRERSKTDSDPERLQLVREILEESCGNDGRNEE